MKSNKFIIIFLVKAILIYIIWYVGYDLWLKKVGSLDNFIVENVVYLTFETLTFFNFNVNLDYHKIWIDQASMAVIVGSGCNGLELFALFTGFILAFTGSWKHKLWFIPLGILIIHFFNVLRIIALTLNGLFSPSMLRFNHKYTFTIILYCLTFFGWMLWVKYYSNTKNQKSGDEQT
jgi:exosortase family protein XrtF